MKRLKYGLGLLLLCSSITNVVGVQYIINKPVFVATIREDGYKFKFKSTYENYKDFMDKTEKLKQENIRKEELKKIALQNTKDKLPLSRGYVRYKKVEIILSFYTTLKSENGGYTTTKYGEPLVGNHNICASNVYPRNTRIYLEELGKELVVNDTGGINFNSPYRLDVLIQRNDGESDREYKRRVDNMGKVKTIGWIIYQ